MKKIYLTFFLCLYLFSLQTHGQFISAGGAHVLYLCNDGTVKSCGYNDGGQLGDGTNNNHLTPIQIPGLTNIVSVAAGYGHSAFLKNNGTVWACGYNASWQLGDSTTINRSSPQLVNGFTGIVAIACGGYHILGLKNDSTVWGCGDIYGHYPVQVIGLSGIIAIAAGEYHSLFLKADGTVWAKGDNDAGQLGDGTNINRSTPVQVSGLTNIVAIAGGNKHSLFLKSDGTVWSCGENYAGELGDSTQIDRNLPVQVQGLTGIIQISSSSAATHSLFLKNDGTMWGCGWNLYNQLAHTGAPIWITPVSFNGPSNIISIACGFGSSIVLKSDGTGWGCGQNVYGGGSLLAGECSKVDSLCTVAVGTEELEPENKISIYPNPSTDYFTIKLNSKSQNALIEIYNLTGEKIYSKQLVSDKIYVNDSAGIYFVRVCDGEKVFTKKLIVQ